MISTSTSFNRYIIVALLLCSVTIEVYGIADWLNGRVKFLPSKVGDHENRPEKGLAFGPKIPSPHNEHMPSDVGDYYHAEDYPTEEML